MRGRPFHGMERNCSIRPTGPAAPRPHPISGWQNVRAAAARKGERIRPSRSWRPSCQSSEIRRRAPDRTASARYGAATGLRPKRTAPCFPGGRAMSRSCWQCDPVAVRACWPMMAITGIWSICKVGSGQIGMRSTPRAIRLDFRLFEKPSFRGEFSGVRFRLEHPKRTRADMSLHHSRGTAPS